MKDYNALVKSNSAIAENIYMLTLTLPESVEVHGGQFANVSTGDNSMLLRRPLGVCIADGKEISLCYQVKGKGTSELTKAKSGDRLSVLLPLGNGFKLKDYKNIAVVGGGVGIFPLAATVKEYQKEKNFYSYLGFRNKSAVCLLGEFDKSKKLTVTTDDGSYGIKGNAVQAFFGNTDNVDFDAIIACGPPVMLKALKDGLREKGLTTPCFVSLEERMGCGVGACLVCGCKSNRGNYARVCKDGPIFNIKEIEL